MVEHGWGWGDMGELLPARACGCGCVFEVEEVASRNRQGLPMLLGRNRYLHTGAQTRRRRPESSKSSLERTGAGTTTGIWDVAAAEERYPSTIPPLGVVQACKPLSPSPRMDPTHTSCSPPPPPPPSASIHPLHSLHLQPRAAPACFGSGLLLAEHPVKPKILYCAHARNFRKILSRIMHIIPHTERSGGLGPSAIGTP